MHRLRVVPLALAVALAVTAAVTTTAVSVAAGSVGATREARRAAAAYPSITIMGPSRLSADQISAFVASYDKNPKIPVTIKELASYYLDEGAAENVRGDIAFAQSIVETGWFEFTGSIVEPGDYNYAGLGACNTCTGGNSYPSPRLGVRAQIQWLRNYADPFARVSTLHRPSMWPTDKYDGFVYKGRSPLWNTMGDGYWATAADYGDRVLGMYQRMLAFNGLGFADVRPSAPVLAGGRSVAMNPNGGYYVLSADGDVLAYGGAPDHGSPRWGWDAARDIAVMPDGLGYVVLDAWGGLHKYGSARTGAMAAITGPYWPGWDIARSIVITPSGAGLAVLDGWGGIHNRGDARPATGAAYWPRWDIARSLALAPAVGYYVLDGWGGLHPAGGAPVVPNPAYWKGWDIARDLVVTSGGRAVLDGFGGVHRSGALAGPGDIGWLPADYWRAIATSDGRWVAVRKDGYVFTS